MLTKADDFPIHQTPEPIAYSGSDRNFYDRYFFNGYDPEGELFFAAALGVYPHLNIMDASFCVVHDGIQYNLHTSKHLKMERLDTQVGCIGIEVIQPLECLAITCDDAAHGLEADLRFVARHAPIEEPRFTRRIGSKISMDSTRMTQNGSYTGWIKIKGKRFDISPEIFRGTRDRSWGIRPVGTRDTQIIPEQSTPQFYWIWAPLNFQNHCSYYHLNADVSGKAWNTKAVLIDLERKNSSPEMKHPSSLINLVSNTRHAKSAQIAFATEAEQTFTINLQSKFNFYMKGLGYGHPEWAHGLNHGELASGYEEYNLKEIDPASQEHLHIQAFCQAILETPEGKHSGCGVLEQLIYGPYAPLGLKDALDMA